MDKKDSAIEAIKSVLKGKKKVTVKPGCRHVFKLKCECCGQMVSLVVGVNGDSLSR